MRYQRSAESVAFTTEPAVPPQRFGLTALPPLRDENAGIAQPRIDPATRCEASRGQGIGRCRRARSDAGDAWASDTIGFSSVGRPAAAGNSTRAWSHVTSQRWNGIMLGRPSGTAGVLPALTPRPLVVRHEGPGIDLLDLITGIGDGVAVRGRRIAAFVIAAAGARGSRLPYRQPRPDPRRSERSLAPGLRGASRTLGAA